MATAREAAVTTMDTISAGRKSIKKHTRDFVRKHLTGKIWWPVFLSVLETLVHDFAGFFSATNTVQNFVHVFDDNFSNSMLIFFPIAFFDIGSEFLLLWFHDLPLCRREHLNKPLIRVGLIGQIITAFSWLGVASFVLYDSLVGSNCPDVSFTECIANAPGLTEVVVILIVLIKNSLMLLAYKSRAFVYPVICDEQLLFYYHLMFKDPKAIYVSFSKFHGLKLDENADIDTMMIVDEEEDTKKGWCSFTSTPAFQVITNFAILVVFDLIGIISVSSVFKGEDSQNRLIHSLSFLPVLIVDIASESVILAYHDLELCKGQDTRDDVTQDVAVKIARIAQVLVELAWIGLLIFLIHRTVTAPPCTDTCNCIIDVTQLPCLSNENCPGPGSVCQETSNSTTSTCVIRDNGECSFDENDIEWIKPSLFPENVGKSVNRTYCETQTKQQCENNQPTYVDCVILAAVVFFNVIIIPKMYFRAHIFPICIPEEVMFLYHWQTDKKRIPLAIAQNEYGTTFTEEDLDALIEGARQKEKHEKGQIAEESVEKKDTSVVDLEGGDEVKDYDDKDTVQLLDDSPS